MSFERCEPAVNERYLRDRAAKLIAAPRCYGAVGEVICASDRIENDSARESVADDAVYRDVRHPQSGILSYGYVPVALYRSEPAHKLDYSRFLTITER